MSLAAPPLPIDVFQQRRAQLLQWMSDQGGGVAILPTGSLKYRNATNPYPFRFDSQFYYLTGFTEPDAWLVLVTQETGLHESILFCQAKDPETEVWDGLRWGPKAAQEAFGVDAGLDTETLDDWMKQHLVGVRQLFAPLHRCAVSGLPTQLERWVDAARSQARGARATPERWIDITRVLSQQRVIKDSHEIALMRKSAHIAAQGHCQAMRAAQPGLSERALEGELLRVFLREGAQSAAYETIVAAGPNACILHHRAGHSVMHANDLVLIDAGCEWHGYASDITRTFPANGRYTPEQAALYDIVLAAQQAAVDQTAPGRSFNAGHEAAVQVLSQGLIDEGLIEGSLAQVIEQKCYQPFYMHRTGHWLGLDVHDAGPYRLTEVDQDTPVWQALVPGMVLTIEPGLYVRPSADVPERFWHIGIRIEDDALVTQNGCELLTRGVPVARDEIEALMRER